MVKATGKLRTFDVELRERGHDPRLVATDVSIDVARSLCRDLVGPMKHAVVRPRGVVAPVQVEAPKYAIWLWSDDKLRWERVLRRQSMTLEEATEWLRVRRDSLQDRMTLVAPAHLSNPAEMLRNAAN